MSPTVVYVSLRTSVPEVYGGEYSLISTASALRDRGVDAHFVITGLDGMAAEIERARLHYDVIPVQNPFDGLRAAGLTEKARRLRDVWRVNRAVLAATRTTGARVVHASGVPSLLSCWLGAKLGGAKVVFHVRGASRNQRTTLLEELAVLMADRTVAVSSTLRAQLIETGRPWLRALLERRVAVVHNGFDFAAIDEVIATVPPAAARAVLGPAPSRPSALLVGGFWTDKGQLRLIERVLPLVVAEVPDFHLTLVGGDKEKGYRERCAAAVRRLGLGDNVALLPYKPIEQVYRHYLAADLVILASEREGLPRAAIEAQAFGRPVVATEVVGVADVVAHGRTGYVVTNDRIEDMAPHLVTLARDPALRQRLGAAGAVSVRERFRLEQNRDAMERVFREVGMNAPRSP